MNSYKIGALGGPKPHGFMQDLVMILLESVTIWPHNHMNFHGDRTRMILKPCELMWDLGPHKPKHAHNIPMHIHAHVHFYGHMHIHIYRSLHIQTHTYQVLKFFARVLIFRTDLQFGPNLLGAHSFEILHQVLRCSCLQRPKHALCT